MRLIDADELKEDYHMADDCKDCKTNIRHCEYDRNYTKMDFCVWLDSAPTVDAVPGQPERKKGTWRHYEGMLTCSVCGAEFYDEIMEYVGGDVPRFCPDCGADLRGDDHGTD